MWVEVCLRGADLWVPAAEVWVLMALSVGSGHGRHSNCAVPSFARLLSRIVVSSSDSVPEESIRLRASQSRKFLDTMDPFSRPVFQLGTNKKMNERRREAQLDSV